MKNIKNIMLLVLAPALAALNCKKMDNQNPSELPTVKSSKFIPVKLESKTQTIELKYLGNTSYLSEVKNTVTGKKEILKYNKDNLLSGFEIYQNDKLVYSSDYFRDVQKRISTVNQFKVNNLIFTLAGYLTLTYNQQNQIVRIKSYNDNDVLISSKNLKYDENSNLISTEKDFPLLPAEKGWFTYDGKNAIFKNVPNIQLVSIESQYQFFGNIVNNILIGSGDKSYSFGYIYNSDNYPQEFTLNESNLKTTYKVSYKTLTD